ncbi:ribonuclease H-like domain-containing protein [Tanacetum coccineum]
MNQFCEIKGIKREFSVARNPQQNRVAERKNRTLIEASRTMLTDLKLPTTFWVEAVNTTCYVQNMVLVIKPHNKTPYELFLGRKPALSFMRPFGCPVTILNTIDHLGKFDGKADEGFFVGYSTNSKVFRVFNSRSGIVEENLHVQFSKNTSNIAGTGPNCLFDIDVLTNSMNYKPIVAGNQSNSNTGTKACDDAGKARVEIVLSKDYILLPLWTQDLPFSSSLKNSPDDGFKPSGEEEEKDAEDPGNESGNLNEGKDSKVPKDNAVDENIVYGCVDDPNIPDLEEIGRFSDAEDDGVEADMTNLDTYIPISPIPTTIIYKDNPVKQIIRDIHSAPQTRRMTKSLTKHAMFSSEQQRIKHTDFQNCMFACFLSQAEPKKVIQALKDPSWIEVMQDELLPNKKDERGIVIKNKARLVAQGYTQEEGIDYDEVFSPIAKIEAIRLFLAYASFKDFIVYQMDVKSAFTLCKIEEEFYVCQQPDLKIQTSLDRVRYYKVEKAFIDCIKLLELVVCACARYQVNLKVSHLHAVKRIFRYLKGQPKLGLWYPKDLPFDLVSYTDSDYVGASLDRKSTTGGCQFLGCRLISWQFKKQTVVLNSITEAEYVAASCCCEQSDLVSKRIERIGELKNRKRDRLFGLELELMLATAKAKTVNGEVQLQALVDGKKVIITEAIYPRFVQVFLDKQLEGMSSHKRIYVTPSHTKKIFRNIKRVWKGFYGRDTPLFPTMMVQAQQEQGKGSAMPTDPQHTPIIIQPSTSQPQKKQRLRMPKRKDTKIPQSSGPTTNVADEVVYKERDDNLVRAATTASSLEAEQDIGNIDKTQSKATPNEPSSLGTSSGGGPNRQDTMGDTIARTRVFDLENSKTAQAQEITSLKLRVKKLEKRGGSRTHKLKRLYKVSRSTRVISSDEASLGDPKDASKQGRKIDDIDKDAEITLVHETQGRYGDDIMFDVSDLAGEEVFVAEQGVPDSENGDAAQSIRSKAEGLVIHEEEQATTPTVSSQQPAQVKAQDKGKGIMVEEPVKIKKKDQISLDEELAFKLQAEEERLARENVQREEQANIIEWDNVQSMIDADYQMAQQMQAGEQEQLSIEKKSKLFVQLLEARKKHFALMRAQEMRNKPSTKAQKRNTISTYLKNMAGYKHNQLKNKSFDDIQKLFDKAIKRVNTFVDMDTKLVKGSELRAEGSETGVEGSSKRAGEELEQEISKKQKLEEDKESEDLKQCLEIIPNDRDVVTIDATPLSTKSPTIVDYKIYKEGKKSLFQIIRADVKARFKKIEPVNYMDNLLLLNLKTMFEHHVEDNNILYYLLVENMYPLTNHTLHQMFNDVKLQVDYECEMAFELLRLVNKQLKEGYVPE